MKLSHWKSALAGCSVESIAFNAAAVTETSTKSLLLGTHNGRIFEASIENSDKKAASSPSPSLVYELEHAARISSLHIEPVSQQHSPTSSAMSEAALNQTAAAGAGDNAAQRLFVMATTDAPTRLYSVLGGPSVGDLFSAARAHGSSPFFTELGSLENFRGAVRAELHCHSRALLAAASSASSASSSSSSSSSSPSSSSSSSLFALLTVHGVYHGSLSSAGGASSSAASSSSLVPAECILEPGLLPYEQTDGTPLSINLTEFHFVLLYRDRLSIVNRLSGDHVQDLYLHGGGDGQRRGGGGGHGGVLGLARDGETGSLWVYSATSLWQVRVVDEDRDVWLLYLSRGLNGNISKFNDALQHAKNDEQRNKVCVNHTGLSVSLST